MSPIAHWCYCRGVSEVSQHALVYAPSFPFPCVVRERFCVVRTHATPLGLKACKARGVARARRPLGSAAFATTWRRSRSAAPVSAFRAIMSPIAHWCYCRGVSEVSQHALVYAPSFPFPCVVREHFCVARTHATPLGLKACKARGVARARRPLGSAAFATTWRRSRSAAPVSAFRAI